MTDQKEKTEEFNTKKALPLIILAGATAVGKSALSIALAKEINGEIISADSMQVYRGMDIGTAKITKEEMQNIPHYLIDVLDPREEFNVYTFQSLAKKAMKEIYAKGHIPILVGGTGFYIQSILYDIEFTEEETDKSYRLELEELARAEGPAPLYEQLRSIDPDAAAQIHPHNIKRVIRALEYYHETGQPISVHNRQQRSRPSPYRFFYLVLNRPRAEIYDRINERVDLMFQAGLMEEVKGLLDDGVPKDAVSMQGLGYKEVIACLEGKLSAAEAAELLKKNTRHFAKRQITWFKREPEAVWMNYEDYTDKQEMIRNLTNRLTEAKII